MPTLVYILGAGHCGSTLLSLALDRHSDILSVSEIVGLNAQEGGYAGGQDIRKHGFWSRVAESYKSDFDEDFWSVPFASPSRYPGITKEQWGKKNARALFSIAKTAGVTVIADASKQPRRLEVLLQGQMIDVRVIYLVRDARAIVHSYDRKYNTMWRGFRQVSRLDRRARSIEKRFPCVPWITLRYEDMSNDFEATIRRCCESLDLLFQNSMLCPDTNSFNGIGGNRLRQKPIEKIASDTSWIKDMPIWKQIFVSLFLRGYQRRWGYSLFR